MDSENSCISVYKVCCLHVVLGRLGVITAVAPRMSNSSRVLLYVVLRISAVLLSSLLSSLLRAQACFDASRELNAFGTGVQIKRKDCFAHACRALFPGNGLVEEWAETAFSS